MFSNNIRMFFTRKMLTLSFATLSFTIFTPEGEEWIYMGKTHFKSVKRKPHKFHFIHCVLKCKKRKISSKWFEYIALYIVPVYMMVCMQRHWEKKQKKIHVLISQPNVLTPNHTTQHQTISSTMKRSYLNGVNVVFKILF